MPRSHLIAVALIRRDDEVLLVRQQGPDDPAPKWSLPGGVAEPGELLHEALIREVREETGLEVLTIGQLAYVNQFHTTSGHLRGDDAGPPVEYLSTAFVFEVAEWRGTLACDDPDAFVTEACFVSREQAITRFAAEPWRVMREPVVAYLRGEVAVGAVWLYRRQPDGHDDLVTWMGESLPSVPAAPRR